MAERGLLPVHMIPSKLGAGSPHLRMAAHEVCIMPRRRLIIGRPPVPTNHSPKARASFETRLFNRFRWVFISGGGAALCSSPFPTPSPLAERRDNRCTGCGVQQNGLFDWRRPPSSFRYLYPLQLYIPQHGEKLHLVTGARSSPSVHGASRATCTFP